MIICLSKYFSFAFKPVLISERVLAKYRVISFGLGPIGRAIARVAISHNEIIDLVGAVDIDPDLRGRDLGEVLELKDRTTGIKVSDSLSDLFKEADIVLHATSSFLKYVKPQLLEFCENGLDVISTNEELSFPWYNHKQEAQELDESAKKNNVTLLGTGVNPGFVLDALAITLSGVCVNISEVRAERVLDATKRRLPFQKKVGIGLDEKEFEMNVRSGKFGHIGLPESIAMVCSALGMPVERIEQRIAPKISESSQDTEFFGRVAKGKVLGLVQDAIAYSREKRIASYHLEMYAGANNPHDSIEIIGEPNITLNIPGGTPGDIATAAIIVNSIPRVIESKPGLMTVKDLRPAAGFFKF